MLLDVSRNAWRNSKRPATEYLCDLANYAMFRFMFPQSGEYFKYTDSGESAGIVGMSVKEMEDFKNNN